MINNNPAPSQQYTPDSLLMNGGFESSQAQGVAAFGQVKAMDGLSQSEKTELIEKAKTLLSDPQLPVGDQVKLTKWIDIVSHYPVTPQDPDALVMNPIAAATNPYMTPGIMAMLFPMLSEIQKIMADIVIQSSKLDQAMTKLTLSMAKEIFNYSIAAGQLRADQLRAEAASHFAQAAFQLTMAVATIGVVIGSKHLEGKAKTELHQSAGYKDATQGAPIKNPQPTQQQIKDGEIYMTKPGPNNNPPSVPCKYDNLNLDRDTTKIDNIAARKMDLDLSSKHTQMEQFANSLIQQLGGAATNITQGVVASIKAGLTEEEAVMSAMSAMLEKLLSTIQQTQQKAIDEGKGASQFFEQMNNMVKEFAGNITRAIYS